MVQRITPYCDVQKFLTKQTGTTWDYGFCYTEEPAKMWGNPNYTFANVIVEHNTGMVITKPQIQFIPDNDTTVWLGTGNYWRTIMPPGYPQGRKISQWTLADPSAQYNLLWVGDSWDYNEGIIFEVGLLPSPDTANEPAVNLMFGHYYELEIKKNKPLILKYQYQSAPDVWEWYEAAHIPLNLKHAWKDLQTDFIWIVPFNKGLLISSDGQDFDWIRLPVPIEFQADWTPDIIGYGGVACFGVHRIIPAQGSIESSYIDMGYIPTTLNELDYRGWADQTDGVVQFSTLADLEDAFKYTLEFLPGKQVMGISKISVNYPPDVVDVTSPSTTIYDVESYQENISEDASAESATIVIKNQHLQHMGTFKRFDELSWNIGWRTTAGDSGVQRGQGVIVDIKDVRAQGHDSTIELVVKPPIQKVLDGSVIFAPDYAGWSVKNALSDFLLRQGVTADEQSITDWPVILPESYDPKAWQPQLGDPCWKWIEEIVYYLLGGWVYNSRDGKIVIEPYKEVEDVGWMQASYIYEHQIESLTYSQPEESIAEIRNVFLVQGMTVDGYPIAAYMRDENSLWNPDYENYVGYPKVFALRDAALSTPELCNWVCSNLYNYFHRMRRKIEIVTNDLGGNINAYPGGALRLVPGDFSGDIGILVRSVSSSISHGSFRQTIIGHYINLSE